MQIHRSMGHVGSLLIVSLSVGCGGDTTEPEPQVSVLTVVSGDGQSGSEGAPVSSPLGVMVTQGGSSLAGTAVTWTVTGGGGSVDPAGSSTDNAGMASTTWTLGPTAGANSVEAAASGATGSPVAFSATALAPAPMQAAVSVGDNFFNPTSQRVAVGGTVTWTWTQNNLHDVTFTSGGNSERKTAGTFDRDFPDAGSFDYLCTVHGASMSGTIVVEVVG